MCLFITMVAAPKAMLRAGTHHSPLVGGLRRSGSPLSSEESPAVPEGGAAR